MRLASLGLVGVVLSAGTTQARAGELEATLRPPRTSDDPSRVVVRGRATGLLAPGALLHVTIRLGKREALFVRTTLGPQGRFGFAHATRNTVAPGTYEARAELILSTQRRALRERLRREYGWPRAHRELVARTELVVGTPGDVRKHRRAILVPLHAIVARTWRLLATGVALASVPAATSLAWPRYYEAARVELKTITRALSEVTKPWWVLWDGARIDALRSVLSEVAHGLRRHQAGKAGGQRVLGTAHTRLIQLVSAYRRDLGLPAPQPGAKVLAALPTSTTTSRTRDRARRQPGAKGERRPQEHDVRCTCPQDTPNTPRAEHGVLCDFAPRPRSLPRVDQRRPSERRDRVRARGSRTTPLERDPRRQNERRRHLPATPRSPAPPEARAHTAWLGLLLFGAVALGLLLVARER